MDRCKICKSEIELIMSFGKMPIANGFIGSVSEKEFFYNLEFCFCPNCHMVQLGETVKPQMMFNEQYHFISSTSSAMARHFAEMAAEIIKLVSTKKNSPFIVELGCNDGIMLKHIMAEGIHHLGIEPSGNVARLAMQNGIKVLDKFFNVGTAQEIVEKYGQADIICGANVMCHIEDINSVFQGLNVLLKEDGVFLFEDPYLKDIISQTSFDQIYDEHVYYFSGLSISQLAKRHNLQLVDMAHQDVHGGSMRYYLRKGMGNQDTQSVKEYIEKERALNLNGKEGYLSFKEKVNKICNDLISALNKIKQQGNKIAGYGATSKSTTLFNYAKIGPDMIDYISDITPTKINKYTPGTHIPIRSHKYFIKDNPPYTLLLAWNHKSEIFKKETKYRDGGGKFIVYFPKVSLE
jgi:methylation protein EvaC